MEEKINFGIFSSPLGEGGIIPISQLLKILKTLGNDIYLITGNKGLDFFSKDRKIILDGLRYSTTDKLLFKILKYIKLQISLSFKILKHSKNVDIWFSIIGSQLILPTISVKLTRKTLIQIIAGSGSKVLKTQNSILSLVAQILSRITNFFSDYIIVYSHRLIEDFGLAKLRKKIIIAPRHFVDPKKFFLVKKIEERADIIGFIGDLSKAKGVLNFLNAISLLTPYKDFEYLIIGDGHDKIKVVNFIERNKNKYKIQLLGWISHNSLNEYMNKLKLLVIPSYTEGLPNVMLEAMASGTPVLASKVGAIPNIIEEGQNGFLLQNIKPSTISIKILEIMKSDLNHISENSIMYIRNNFTFEITKKKYKIIISYIYRKSREKL